MNTNISPYLKTKVETASPAQLILILYDELIKNLTQAGTQIRDKHFEAAHLKLVKAQEIVGELAGSINLEAGSIATNLLSLYQFMINELVQANLNKDENRITPILDMVGNLRKAWWTSVIVVNAAKK